MFQFKAYPPNAEAPYAFYVVGLQGVKITRKGGAVNGSLQISGTDSFTKRRIENELKAHGIDLATSGLREFYASLQDAGLVTFGRGRSSYAGRSFTHQNRNTHSFDENLQKTPQQLMSEASMLNLSTCPFKDSTINNVSVIISSNETQALAELFRQTKLKNISVAHLPVADIIAINNKTGDTLFIERKTTQDLYSSVTVDQRSHDQSERLFDAVNELRQQGVRARAIWLVEAQNESNVMLHSTLPIIQAVDGLINYFDMINDQSVHQTFGMRHSVYVTAKYIQGFFEQKLCNPVQTGNTNVMRSYKERVAAKTIQPTESRNSGVTRHTSKELAQMLSYIPSVNTAVAKALANTGKSFAEILQMTQPELEAIKGVGKKTAENIVEVFNMRQQE